MVGNPWGFQQVPYKNDTTQICSLRFDWIPQNNSDYLFNYLYFLLSTAPENASGKQA